MKLPLAPPNTKCIQYYYPNGKEITFQELRTFIPDITNIGHMCEWDAALVKQN